MEKVVDLLRSVVILLTILISFACSSANAHTVVIVNPQTNIEPIVELGTLRALFAMKLQTWPSGEKVTVFVLADAHPLHRDFSQKCLGILPYRLRRNWDRLLFSGTGVAPTIVENKNEMLRRVATTPGSIGYANKEFLNDTVSTLTICN